MTNLDVITPKLIENLLQKWHSGNFDTEDLEKVSALTPNAKTPAEQKLQLQEYLYQLVSQHLSATFLEISQSQNPEPDKIPSALSVLFKEQPSDYQTFALIYCRYLNIRQYRVQKLADLIHTTTRTLRRHLLKGFTKLSTQIKVEISKNSDIAIKEQLKDHFPVIEADQVIGITPLLAKLNSWLDEKDAPRAISIEGIGGIGKTLLTQYLLEERYQANANDDYIWVSARQDEFSFRGELNPVEDFVSTLDDVVSRLAQNLGQNHLAGLTTEGKLTHLKHLCAQKKLLIIIDNLETVDDVDKLVPALLKLNGRSSIIFTSRQSISQYPSVRTFRIPELSFENSHALVMGEIKRLGLQLSLEEETMRSLYEITGGIPLALKLATAQIGDIPANEIIQLLREGKESAQNMYVYIYRQAWLLLDDIGKSLLISMFNISPDGEDRDWICDLNGLSEDIFTKGLRQLKRLSLVEFAGSIERPLYRIHRLTTTFLKTDILRDWESE